MPEPTSEIIRHALLDAMADPDDCGADEDDCFRRHPVHLGWSDGNGVQVVYVQVDKVGEVIAAALRAAGRLLPEGGQTLIEWEVRWYAGDGYGIRYWESGFASRGNAEERGPQQIGNHGITRFSVHRREVRQHEDGSAWISPWVAVDREATDG